MGTNACQGMGRGVAQTAATWLGSHSLFPGLLDVGQVKHPRLADASFLEALAGLRNVGSLHRNSRSRPARGWA